MKKNISKIKPFIPLLSAFAGGFISYFLITQDDISIISVLKESGDIYLRLLTMCVIPIILTAIVSGVAKLFLDHADKIKSAGIRIILTILGSFIFVIIMGVTGYYLTWGLSEGLSNKYGIEILKVDREAIGELVQSSSNNLEEIFYQTGDGSLDIQDPITLKDYFPKNIFEALSSFYAVQLVIFSLLLGFMIGYFPSLANGPEEKKTKYELAKMALSYFELFNEIFLNLVKFLLKFLWLALFILIAHLVATQKEQIAEVFQATALFLVAFNLIGIIIISSTSIIIWWFSDRLAGFWKTIFVHLMKPVSTAFLTMNSFATMPVAVQTLDDLGFEEESASLYMGLFLPILRFGNIFYFIMAASFFVTVFDPSDELLNALLIPLHSIMPGFATIGTTSVVAIQPIIDVFDKLNISGGSAALLLLMAVDSIVDPMRTTLIVHCNTAVAAILSDKKKTC